MSRNERSGSNQADLRQSNEKLILSLLRRAGSLPKAEIARATGLSAQTVSVIMNALESGGMLERGTPLRGRVGQPSVPMSLAPDGAFFFGAMIGRRTVDLVLVDMVGAIRQRRNVIHSFPAYDACLTFVADGVADILSDLSAEARGRVSSIGIAMPGRLWDWADDLGLAPEELSDWQTRDFAADLVARTGLPVRVENDANSACAAELIFGPRGAAEGTLFYLYIGHFIGGGIAMDGRLFSGAGGNAASIGSLLAPRPDGSLRQMLELASLGSLTTALGAAGKPTDMIWQTPLDWSTLEPEVSDWMTRVAPHLAMCIHTATAMVEADLVIIDGYMPDAARTKLATVVETTLGGMDFRGLVRPRLLEGSFGPDARAIGAAAVPLSERFLL